MANPPTRETMERSRRLLKRDYNRIVEEMSKLIRQTANLDILEQVDALKTSLLHTKTRLDDMYFDYMSLLDSNDQADARLEEELLRDRDTQFLNVDKMVGLANAVKKKFDGASKRDSLNASVVSETSSQVMAKLPKISVPTFNGDYRKFLDFKALFENLVHNDENIPAVRKMHYLKESLVGEATSTLANLSVSEDGYKEAWSRVISKYDNKRLIIHTHFNDLFSTEKIKSEASLRVLVDRFDSAIRGFRICNQSPDTWSPILAYMMYTRLDQKTRSDYDNQAVDSSNYVNFKSLFKFCETRSHNIEARKYEELPAPTSSNRPSNSHAPKHENKRAALLTSKPVCVACKEQHLLIDCNSFLSRSPAERLQLIKSNKMCVNCFSSVHQSSSCASTKRCKLCAKLHHTMLHLPDAVHQKAQPNKATGSENAEPTDEKKFTSNVTVPSKKSFVVLPSAVVRFECGNLSSTARVLLDDCSQPTLISDVLVRKFKLPTWRNPSHEPIHGVGFDDLHANRVCSLRIASRYNSFHLDIQAEVIPASAIRYVVNSVSWKECPEHFKEIKSMKLADPAFYQPTPFIDQVDLLLGAEFSELCKLNETVHIENLTLRNTQFGWTLIGPFPSGEQQRKSCFMTTNPSTYVSNLEPTEMIVNIDAQLMRFWHIEAVPEPMPEESPNLCETYFRQTTERAADGRYVVRLPFVAPPTELEPNYAVAARIHMKNELRRKPELEEPYVEFMQEYEQMGHMTRVQPTRKGNFIPHLAVLKPSSTTTRVRVVFNASSTTKSGSSLNDVLAVGPLLQPDLFSALVRFRSYRVALTGDITKMYRCVWIHPDDRVYQKIVWRPDKSAPLAEYELNTVTYGTAPASFLATRCLKAIANEISEHQPEASQVIERHFYMDDLLTGATTEDELIALRTAVHAALGEAGFELRKYQSNSEVVLATIPPECIETRTAHEFCPTGSISILGLFWEPTSDTLRIRADQPSYGSTVWTKRKVLSEIAKVFDPLGLASPFTIRAKIFLQKVWLEGIQWDDRVSTALAEEILQYFSEFPALASFAVPRASTEQPATERQLIGFSDASDKAYCACIYLRSTRADGVVTCLLICAKTRVAPLKALTIPRLELQGALLLAELMQRVTKIFSIESSANFLFSDSEVVLAWLAKPENSWDVFVKNRVQKIHALYPFCQWSYVYTKDNPADLGTRGVPAQTLTNSNLWSFGPSFLFLNNFFRLPNVRRDFQTNMEIKSASKECHQVVTTSNECVVERFSNYKRLIAVFGRVVQWVRRWRKTRPDKDEYNLNDSLSVCLSSARTVAIRVLQVAHYSPELHSLRQSKTVSTTSSLSHLSPFLDEEGIIRVQGRLQNAEVSFAKKHPILVPKNCQFLKIYADHIHQSFCHANKKFVVRYILAEFYPVGGVAQMVKARIRKCLSCIRAKATTFQQIMGPLPAARVNISRPFTHCGVDFCGPFNARCTGHRSIKYNKVYACVFVCLTTRAVHIEVSSDLTSAAFLMALHRFVARRGTPAAMYSDQGTNFVGASNYLSMVEEEIQKYSGIHRIEWKFNPSRTPHRGGLWEAAVKAAKAHLTRVVGEQPLNFEEYSTLFSRIESVLNSRPLCYHRTSVANEEFVLTPNHFLIGSSPHVIPEPEPDDGRTKLPLMVRYNLLRTIIGGFWRAWRADYLNMLQRREKWLAPHANIEAGQVVILKSNTPPSEWPLARVESILPGVDGQVRTVVVRYQDSMKRVDIRSLVKLPSEDEP